MVSKRMIDLVTVVFKDELPILKVQAESVDLYCKELGIKTIFVIVNDADSVADQIDPVWWGSLSNCVKIIPRSFFKYDFVENGWVSQQVLKVLASALSTNQFSMILDAKTIFVKPATLDLLLPDGKIAGGLYKIQEVFSTSARIVGELFNVVVDRNGGLSGVPFIFNTNDIHGMIAEIEHRTKDSFPNWFQDQGMVTEYILYVGYCIYRYGNLDKIYSLTVPYQVANLCHSQTGIIPNKLLEMAGSCSLTVSVHRRAWTVMTQEQQHVYKQLLINRGIKTAESL